MKKIIIGISLVATVILLMMTVYLYNKPKQVSVEPEQILQAESESQKVEQPEENTQRLEFQTDGFEKEIADEQPKKVLELEGVITAVNDSSVEVENRGVKTIIPLTGNEELIVRSPGKE
ncbi:MAG: hypothetical protein UT48_C0014G0024 [Parcubacteria group bacterium GW2011_GWE2_39_37]|uniref:Uncharacterized protein n=1 Tax=Candidatus Falkowbacteria bacterium GW2011_GWF2_39_8 TaxID=1618642 RepID=A0A0G0Q1K3_9BACT|nr:MAG: hypothetical protein UT48_C0014G0024 [Parcubacteria group bacterium GW2011_GWE2_39_37]KKR31211.1 MAG: hypothetical protein UT64_C0069G0010 [Candidatus Falkowbacteria bacterium GW2011_GWF2_39_8]